MRPGRRRADRRSRAGAGSAGAPGRRETRRLPTPSPRSRGSSLRCRRIACPKAGTAREVGIGQVNVGEQRSAPGLERGEKRAEDVETSSVLLRHVLEEGAPRAGDRRQTVPEVRRQRAVEVDDAGVGEEASHPAAERLPGTRAEIARAQPGQRLRDVQVVRVREEREQVVWVLGMDGQTPVLRVHAREDRRHRVDRPRVDRRRVAKPGRVLCESGEVRIALRVDLHALVEERRRGELVEDENDDRRLRRGACGPSLRLVRQHELAHR